MLDKLACWTPWPSDAGRTEPKLEVCDELVETRPRGPSHVGNEDGVSSSMFVMVSDGCVLWNLGPRMIGSRG